MGYVDPSGHICDKKYNELKSKDPSQLTDLERAQIAEYEAMKAQGMSPENSKTSYAKQLVRYIVSIKNQSQGWQFLKNII